VTVESDGENGTAFILTLPQASAEHTWEGHGR
jgi:hypothetical protein